MAGKFEIYKDKTGEFRWRPTHLNGKIIADKEQGHQAKVNAVKSLWWGALAATNSR